MSAQKLITKHLDLWTGAITKKSTSGRGRNGKIELTGINRLRELILELASRGALIPRIDDSARLLKLQEFAELVMGQAPPGSECNKNGIGEIFVKTGEFGAIYPEVKEWTTKPLRMARPGDVLICVVGATVGKLNMAIDCAIGRSVAAIRPDQTVIPEYLYYCLIPFTLKIRSQSKGSAQGVIGKAVLNNVELRVPLIDEQKLIVQKVDELMALCDRLEQQTSDQLEAHETLVDTLLTTLTQSENATELADNWARLSAHFDTLFTTEQSIDKLKQAILQLAVMGRLVEQNERDEPAEHIVKYVDAEIERRVIEGTIKKPKALTLIDKSEPYNLPNGWRWEKLGRFTLVGTGATPSRGRTDYFSPPDYPWVTSGETNQPYINDTKEHVSNLAVKETNISIYPAGTLIIAMYGQGKTRGQISELKIAAGTNQACAAVQPIIEDVSHRQYIKLCFVKLYDEIRGKAAGGAQPNLNTGKIANTLIPLPPIEEQHRIVQKVDELMAFCDQLKERLSHASETRCHLAEAVVKEAVA